MFSRPNLVRLLFALLVMAALIVPSQPESATATSRPNAIPVFVDVDTGVDDAVALALLLRTRSINMLGITTVMGNTTVDNATRNTLTILDIADRDVPVTRGAAAPLTYPFSTVGKFIHGPDGLWFAQQPQDITSLPQDAPLAIATAARANPTMTLLALGPLTNVAQAVQRFPQDMAQVNIVALVGAQKGGNRTAVAEANAFNDPQALDIVLRARLKLTVITLEAFEQVEFNSERTLRQLTNSRDPLFRFLVAPLTAYANAQTQGGDGPINIPDAIAAAYVIRSRIANPESALVFAQTDNNRTRGQTIIMTDPNLKVSTIADDAELSALADAVFSGQVDPNVAIGQILAREPDNAKVILKLKLRGNVKTLGDLMDQ